MASGEYKSWLQPHLTSSFPSAHTRSPNNLKTLSSPLFCYYIPNHHNVTSYVGPASNQS